MVGEPASRLASPKALEFCRFFDVETEGLAGDRMGQPKTHCPQKQALSAQRKPGQTVDRIAKDRMTSTSEMTPQLVGATRMGPQIDGSRPACTKAGGMVHGVESAPRLPPFYRRIKLSLSFEPANHNRPVLLEHRTPVE